MYDASQLLSAIRSACGRPDVIEVPDEEILRVAGEVIDSVAVYYLPPSLRGWFDVTTSSEQATIPDDVLLVTGVFVSEIELKEMNFQQVARLRQLGGSGGTPIAYSLVYSGNGGQPESLLLWPAPTSNISVRIYCIRRHPQLVASPTPTEILLEPTWFPYLVEESAARVLAALQKRQEASLHRQLAQSSLELIAPSTRSVGRPQIHSRIRSLIGRVE